jgi:hypothetical protein
MCSAIAYGVFLSAPKIANNTQGTHDTGNRTSRLHQCCWIIRRWRNRCHAEKECDSKPDQNYAHYDDPCIHELYLI